MEEEMSTTWIIEPHGWGWVLLVVACFLLVVATVSLVAIAIRMWKQSQVSQVEAIPRTSNTNWIIYLWFTIGIFALIISVFDYQNGRIIIRDNQLAPDDTLSILVAFLVAWQIWQTMMTRSEVEKATEAGKRLDVLTEMLNRTQKVAEGHAWSAEANNLFNVPTQRYMAFKTYAEALRLYIEGQADYTRHIHQVLDKMDALVNNDIGNLGRKHWVIVHKHDVDEIIDEIASQITTLETNVAQAKSKMREIRDLIDRIRSSYPPR